MKKSYEIVIEEVISQEFHIEAENSEEALKKAIADYKKGKLVVDNGRLITTNCACVTTGETTEWIEI